MKKLLIILILITASNCYSQYVIDSVQVEKIRLLIAEREYLSTENDSLISRCKLFDKKVSLLNLENAMQDSIINYKEKQIVLLENKPIEVREIKTSFWTYAGIVVSSIATGIIIGTVVK